MVTGAPRKSLRQLGNARLTDHPRKHLVEDGMVDRVRMSLVECRLFKRGGSSFRGLAAPSNRFLHGRGVRPLGAASRHNDPSKTWQLDVSLPMRESSRKRPISSETRHNASAYEETMGRVSADETHSPCVIACVTRGGVSLPMKTLLSPERRRESAASTRLSPQRSSPQHFFSRCSFPQRFSGGRVSPDETLVSLPVKTRRAVSYKAKPSEVATHA
jgi:hypothetical protein